MRRVGRKRKAAPVTLAVVRALAAVPTMTLDRDGAPTPERLARAGLTVATEIGTGRVQIIGSTGVRIVDGDGAVRVEPSTLDRLHARGRLDATDPYRNCQLAAAGERLRYHHYRAGMSGFVSAANDRALSGQADPSQREVITEAMEASRRAFYRAEAAMHPGDWPVVQAIVIEEHTLEAAGHALGLWARTSAVSVALDRLRRGLQELAELWGFLTPELRDAAAPVEPANANTPRSISAGERFGLATAHCSVAQGLSTARLPAGGLSEIPASKASICRRDRSR